MNSCIHLKLSFLVYNFLKFNVHIFLYVDLEIFVVEIVDLMWVDDVENIIMQMELDIL